MALHGERLFNLNINLIVPHLLLNEWLQFGKLDLIIKSSKIEVFPNIDINLYFDFVK